MEASSTYLKTNFLRFIICCVAAVVVLFAPFGEVMGQEREYADVAPSNGRNGATILLGEIGGYSPTTNNSVAQIQSPANAGDADETTPATLQASNVSLLAVQWAGEAWIQMKFPTNRPANTIAYVRLDQPTGTGLGVDLISALGGLLGLLENNVIIPEVYAGATTADDGTKVDDSNVSSTLVRDGAGNLYLAVSSSQEYNSIRVKLRNQLNLLGLSLGSTLQLNVYEAFTISGSANCGESLFTDLGSSSGVIVSLNNIVQNPQNAIDANGDTYSTITTGAVSLLGSIFQTFHFHELSAAQDYFKIKLRIGGGGALDLNLLGNFEVRAYNGNELVYTKKLNAGLVNGIDLLTLFQSGDPVTVPFGPGVPFDRIAIGINTTASVSLAANPLDVYSVERYGLGASPLTCVDPEPIPLPEPTDPMLSISDCDATVVAFEHANFPYNTVDGNNDTYTTLEASSGIAGGIGAYEGFIELGFEPRAAGTTTYIRIDFDDEVLSGLLDGNVGELAGDLLNNVLFGEHYFTVEAKNAGSAVLTRSSNVGFSGTATGAVGAGDVKIVQDKNGHYYVAVTPAAAYNSLRITEELGALLGLGEIRNMNVYHMCIATGSEACEQAFATYSERGGLTLDLLSSGNFGVSNAHLAIDDNAEAVENDNTYSEIGLGAAAVGASVFQSVQFHTLSAPTDYFKVKFGVANGSVLNVDLLNNIEIRAYNGDELVYSQRIQNGIVANLDILGLLSSNGVVTLPIGPGMAFDRVAIGISSLAGLDAFTAPLRIYSIKRFGADCPDPNPLPESPVTEPPFNTPDCGVELGDFEHVNFAYNAIDGNHDTYATISAGSGVILGLGGFDGFIDMSYDTPISARELSYIRIDMADEGLLNALVGGSLGEFVADIGDVLLFGNHYFDISVRNPSGGEIYNASSANGFGNNNVRIVRDKVGRYYIAFTAAESYQSVRITLRNTAAVGADAVTTMNVYGMCRETEFDPCEQATFTSYDGTGLSLNLFEGANPAGVINPQYAIDDNNSNYAELTLGTAGVGATIFQDIYYKTKSSDNVRLRLQSPSTLLNVDLLGAYKVYLFNGDQQVFEGTLQQDGLINGLDLLGLLNSGGIVGIEFAPGVIYDRVRIELGSVAALGIGSPIRLYGVYRISDECPDPEFAEPPFQDCADVVVSGEHVDDIQNLIDGNHNSYATVRSDAGLVLGISAYSGHVELGYQAEKVAGTTSYIRISYDEGILDALAGGTLGGFLGDLIEAGVLGHHYFNVIVKDGDGNEVLTRSSLNGFLDNNLDVDPQVRIVQDRIGRYYLAVTPTVAYQSIRLEDHITSAVGVLASEGHLNVYGMCNTPIDEIECVVPFTTSFDGTGLSADLLGTGGAGVQNAFWAIDDNTSNFSTLSLGNISAVGSIQQNIQFNKVTEPNTTLRVRLAVGDGSGLSANVFSTLQVIGYLNNEEVFVEDFDQAFVGVNLADLLNNGNPADLTMVTEDPIDEIAIRLSSLAGVGVAPNVRLYAVTPDCDLPQFVAWKSYVVDGDATLGSVKGGEEVVYTIHVRNTGQVALQDLIITDALPANTTFVESADGTLDGSTVTFNGIDVPVDGEATVSFTVAVDANLTGVSEIVNVALVKTDASDPGKETFPPLDNQNPADPDESGDTGTIIPVEQISSLVSWKAYAITGGASTTSVSGGETVEYSIYVRNLGNQDLTNVVISDVLPEGVAYVSGGSLSGNTVQFTIATLPVGATSDPQVFTVTVDENLTGIDVIRNVATVVTDEITTPEESFPPIDNENPTDPDDSGDTGTDIPVDHVSSVVSWKAYEVNGDASVTAVSGGETVEYTIYVRNTGNVNLTNLTISDVLPAGVTWVSGGNHAGGTVTFTIPTLVVGATSPGLTFTVEVAEDLTGIDVIRNVATVVSDEVTTPEESFPPVDNSDPEDGGPDDSGDTGTTIDVTPVHDVTIALIGLTDGGSNGPAVTGEVITYTITVENTGNKGLTGVELDGLIPENTTFEGSDDGGAPSGNTVNFPPFDLGVGESRTFTYQVEVGSIDPTVVESIDNTATVTYRNEDNTADETETAQHSMQTACIQVVAGDIDLQASALEVCEGEEVTLTATATGIAGADFLWFTNPGMTGAPIATGASVTVTPESPETTYYVMLVADGYCFQTPPATITIVANPLPPVPTINLTGDATICEGESLELTATTGADSYAWYLDGTLINGQTSNVLIASAPGVYTVLAVNGDCASAISAGVTIEVLPLPVQPTITYDGAPEICEGSIIILTSSATTGNQWYKDGIALTDSTRQQLVVTEAGDYTVVVTGSNGCPSAPSDAVSIVVNPTSEITIDGPANYAITIGGTVQLPAVTTDPAGAAVTWRDPDGNPVSGVVGPFNTPGTYIYTVVAESGDCSTTASISIVVFDPNACPPGYERIYATEVIGSTTGITSPNSAIGDDLVDSANVQIPLLLFGVRNFDLGFGQSFTGEDIHVKLGTRQGVDLLGGVEVSLQPLQDGNPVGTAVSLNSGWLLSLLAGADQGDVMIPTADDVTFNGVRVRVRSALISLAGAIDVHAAYVNTKVTELADCEEVSDILTGSTSGVLGSLNGVTNKWAVAEDDLSQFATIRQNVGVAGHVHLTTIYPSQAKAGDSVQVILRNPSGGLLDASVLAGIWVRAYNGNTLVKETAVSGALLNVRLLDGSSDINIVSFPVETPFDRVEVRAGGIASALTSLDVFRIQRIADINIVTPMPVDGIVEVCQGADITLEADDCGTTYEWFENMTGGTAIAEGLVFTVPTDWAPGLRTLYVQPKRFGCDYGARIPIVINVLESPTADDITVEADEDIYCVEDEVVLTATAVATIADPQFNWYFDADKLEPIVDGAEVNGVTYTILNGEITISGLSAGNYTYYVSVRSGADGCENAAGDLASITVTVDEEPAPALTELAQVFCEIDMPTVADLNTDGATGTVVWYSAATGGTPLAADAALTAGTYYAAQVGENCESVDRTAVTVTITETPAPALTELAQVFCEIDMPTVADLNTDGATGTVVWYSAATGGTPLAADAALTAGTYYAAQVGENCESVDRTAVTVTITETPAPTIDNAAPEFCETDNMTLADLQVAGTDIKWYASATSTEVLPATTVLENGVTYYATQMGDNCESAERLAVTPVINDCTALLSITKTADQDRVIAGESTTFTLTITNEGPGAIQSGDIIKLGERPSEGVVITGYEVTSGNGTINGSGNSATVTANALIPTGGTITLKVTATVDADAPETIANGIDVWGPDKDPETDPKDDEDDTPPIPVDRVSTLGITKVADEARVKAGESTSFTLTITNNGPSFIQVGKEISLTERPGEGVTITGYEVTAGAATVAGSGNTAVLTTTGKIAVGGTITVKVTANVAANAGETITNGITVWGPDKDPENDPEDDEDDTPPIPVDREAVLSITKVADQARVKAGESTSFTLTITNQGPAVIASGKVISLTERPGQGVTITGYEVTSGNGTAAGAGNAATVTTSEAIAVGATIVVKVTANVAANAGETITNGITVWGPDKDPETDPEDDEDDTPPIPVDHESVLSITKSANDQRVIAGGTTSFTVTVTNNGPAVISVGKTIAVEERPSAGLVITGYDVTSGNATIGGSGNDRQLTTTAAIAVGGSITFDITANVTAPAGSTIANGVAVWGPDKNPDTDDEDDEDETPEIPVERPYVLSVEKVADQSLVTAGQTTTFTVTVTNNGPMAIESGKEIALRERPGAGGTITGYQVVSGAASVVGAGNQATITTTGVIDVNSTIVIKITADVAETATGTITNGISVWAPDRDPDTDDPDDEDDTDPVPVDATLIIPNLFTPNGDGLNDLFVIKNLLQYQGRELTVINRWGNQVYKSNNYNNDWDGGSLAEGTYYYILRVRNGSNGEWRTYKGAVALIRVTGR